MEPIRVLIVDDQHLFAESLKFVLQGESGGTIEVVGIGENGRDAVTLVEDRRPDVVLMDIRMPVMDGVEASAAIHRAHPGIKIMILTTFDDDELAVNALSHGATGYVLKDVDPPDLILSIRAVHNGAFYISPSIGCKIVDMAKQDGHGEEKGPEELILKLLGAMPVLSRREAEILHFAARAQPSKQIADRLFISEKTVKNHLSSIYEKLGIHNRLELINRVISMMKDTR